MSAMSEAIRKKDDDLPRHTPTTNTMTRRERTEESVGMIDDESSDIFDIK